MANSTALTGNSNVVINIQNKKALDLDTVLDTLNINTGISWAFGTGANQANCLWHDTRTLADGGTETIDLYASGTEVDAFGGALTMAALKLLYIKNNSDDATLKVLGTAVTAIPILSDPSDIIEIGPGGFLLWALPTAAGLDITTNKNLKIEHDGTGSDTMDVDIVAMGLD